MGGSGGCGEVVKFEGVKLLRTAFHTISKSLQNIFGELHT